jgi:PsbP
LEGFAGADYDLQDALTAATDKKANKRTVADGADFYDYEVVGPDSVYLASVTLKGGKVFALFVSSPAKAFAGDEAKLRRIVESFKTL